VETVDNKGSAIKTYWLAEVADMVLPDMTRGVRWRSQRLNRSELPGYRVGRSWRMTHGDVEDLIERYRNSPSPSDDQPAERAEFPSGLTPTSRRRVGHSDP
jgi:hypothetical protein